MWVKGEFAQMKENGDPKARKAAEAAGSGLVLLDAAVHALCRSVGRAVLQVVEQSGEMPLPVPQTAYAPCTHGTTS